MRLAFKVEPKYRVTMLTTEECSRRHGTPSVVKGLFWYTDGSRMKEGTGVGVCGQCVGRRLNISLWRYATVFQAEILLSWHVLMKLNCMIDREVSEYLLWQPGGTESPSGRQNNVSTGATAPKDAEWYLHPAYCRAVLGPWACWGTRKRNHLQALKRWFCSKVCWTWAVLRGL